MTTQRSAGRGLRLLALPASRSTLRIDARGRFAEATQVRSPNHDARPPDTAVSLLVIHGISLPPGEFGGDGIVRLFTNRLDPSAHPAYAALAALRVSAHLLIRRDGALIQFVDCNDRAWHAGVSSWQGKPRCNDYSIGIELEGTDTLRYAERQYAMLARVTKALRRRYPIAYAVGHSDIAPDRKTDPGPAFDWARLRKRLAPRGRSPG